MIYAAAFYVLVTGMAQFQLREHGGTVPQLFASLLVGWFMVPARGLAKLVS